MSFGNLGITPQSLLGAFLCGCSVRIETNQHGQYNSAYRDAGVYDLVPRLVTYSYLLTLLFDATAGVVSI